MESKNVTCLATHEQGMIYRAARVSVVQEHSLTTRQRQQLKHRLNTDHSKHFVAGPTDPNNVHNAKVGAIEGAYDTLFEFVPITQDFKKVRDSGRAIHMGYGMGKCGVVFSIFNVYGFSGGAHDPKKAKGTSRILRACIQEALHFPANPKLLTGDLNGDFETFPELQTLCDSMGWHDLNAIASTWGQQNNMPTCRTAQSCQPTIRDYCLACPAALPMIKQFRVLDADLCPVHSTLQIHIVPPKSDIWQYQSTPKRPLKELMEETFSDRFGQGPRQLPEDLHIDLEQHLGDTTLTAENAKPEVRVTPHPYLQKEADRALRDAKAHYGNLQANFNTSAKRHMDACVGVVDAILQKALMTKNLTLYWQCLWEAIEGSIVVFTGKEQEEDARRCRGRGEQPVKYAQHKLPRVSEV
jgi:hypothetical protein